VPGAGDLGRSSVASPRWCVGSPVLRRRGAPAGGSAASGRSPP